MADVSLNNLRSDVVRRATNSFAKFVIRLQTHSQPKINELNLLIVVEQYITEFEIAVYNFLRLEIKKGVYKLFGVILHFDRMESFAHFEKTFKCALGTQL